MLSRLVLLAVAALLATATSAGAMVRLPEPLLPVAANPAERLLAVPIEGFGYDAATGCSARPRPGMLKFTEWLRVNARGVSWGTYRCERWGRDSASLHAEGRALDWHLDVADRADRAQATRLILLLLAPDSAANPQALARRMGIEEIIWDCGYWALGMTQFAPYRACYDRHGRPRRRLSPTVAHRDHIHFGMTKRGAAGRSSFWAQ